MVRPMWHSPRYSEADTSETLQSDVMRFMAILALCLVAIFALVQSLPMRPVEPMQAPQTAPVEKVLPAPQPVTVAPATVPEPKPAPAPEAARHKPKAPPGPKLVEPVVQLPPAPSTLRVPEPVDAKPIDKVPETKQYRKSITVHERLHRATPEVDRAVQPASENSAAASTSKTQEGLLLRFASDTAFLALVAQRRVDVYGWMNKTAWKLSSERGMLSFVAASAPKRFHSMASHTVPSPIALALSRVAPEGGAHTVTWGVTLPADTARQLEQLVNKHTRGTLVIHANGRVRLESAG